MAHLTQQQQVEIELEDKASHSSPTLPGSENNPQLLNVHQNQSQVSSMESSASSIKSKHTEGSVGGSHSVVSIADQQTESRSALSKRTFTGSAKTSKTRTSRTSTSVRLRTCCGTIELNCIRIVSLVGMIVNVMAFIVILAMSIQAMIISSVPVLDILQSFSTVTIEYQRTSRSVYLGVITKNNDTAYSWYQHKDTFVTSLNSLLALLPPETSKGILNESSDASSLPILATQQAIIETAMAGDYNTSASMLQSNLTNSSWKWDRSMKYFLSSVQAIGQAQYDSMSSSLTVNLAIIGICLCVAIPVCIAIFVLTIRKERETTDRLKSVNLIMLMNTMNDPFFRDLFGQFCSQHNQTTYSFFKLLETLQQIKQGLNQLIILTTAPLHTDDSESTTTDVNVDSQVSSQTASTIVSYGEEETSIKKRLLILLNDLIDHYINPKSASTLGNVRFVDTMGVKNMIADLSNPIQASSSYLQKNKKQNKTDLYAARVEQAQNYVGESLLSIHAKFKAKLSQPASTRKNLLRKYRILFKQHLSAHLKQHLD